jgi:hypothetical protein
VKTACLVAVLAAAVVLSAAAHADADPASDILLSQDTFLPFFGEQASEESAEYLRDVVESANRQGFRIKVAVIGSNGDLGGVFSLMGKPKTYAPFLGRELTFVYKGRLLISMPDGFGFFWFNHDVTEERELLETVPIKPGTDGLVDSTAEAVKRLAAADGITIDVQKQAPESDLVPKVLIAGGGTVLLLAIALGVLVFWLRRRTPAQ